MTLAASDRSAASDSYRSPALPRSHRSRRIASGLLPYAFVAPALIFIAVFIYAPVLFSIGLSFSDWNFIRPEANFVGFDNYFVVLTDPNFHAAARNTLIYVLILAPIQVILPLLLARMLAGLGNSRIAAFYKSALFVPTIVAYSIAGATWLWLLNPIIGFFNAMLRLMGSTGLRWAEDPNLAIWSVAMVVFWKTFGLNLILYLAAFTAIPKDIIEASRLDAATPLGRLIEIEVPMVSPTIFFVMVTTILGVMDDIVGIVSVMTDGGPINATTNLLFYLYEKGMRYFQFGHASAVAVLTSLAVLFVTWLQFRFVEKKVFYG